MSLADLLLAVPCLAEACTSTQLRSREPAPAGSDLKNMRLLSKDMEITMARYVHSCSIELGSHGSTSDDSLQDMNRVTRLSRLSRLKVVLLKPKSEPSTLECAAHVERQVEILISLMGAALQTITRLELDVQDVCDNASFHARDMPDDLVEHTSTLTEVLAPLAAACPAVEQLHVAGSVGRSVLAALGTSCKHLTALEVGNCDVPIASLQRLHLLLPCLSHLTLLPSTRVFGRYDERQPRCDPYDVYQSYANEVLHASRDCPGITDLDAAWVVEGGTSLPSSLQRARLAAANSHHGNPNPPPSPKPNPELRALTLHCEKGRTFSSVVARAVGSAPLLSSLCLVKPTSEMRALSCLVEPASNIILLQERSQQGITISAVNSKCKPVNMLMVLCAGYSFLGHDIPAHTPGLSVEHSDLEVSLQQLSVTQVTIFQEVAIAQAIAGHSLHLLSKIFPHISCLVFSDCALGPVELQKLASCASLLCIEFSTCRDLTVPALLELCSHLPLLKILRLTENLGLNEMKARALRQNLGPAVDVQYTW